MKDAMINLCELAGEAFMCVGIVFVGAFVFMGGLMALCYLTA